MNFFLREALPLMNWIVLNEIISTFGTAAWNMKSVNGSALELRADIDIVKTLVSPTFEVSKSNCTVSPFFSNAVMGGTTEKEKVSIG